MAAAPYSFRIGEIEALVIADESAPIPPDRFNSIFNRDEDQAIRDAFAQLTAPVFGRNILSLKTPTHHILIDTGEGYHVQSHLLERLQAAGVQPDQIDLIIITHFHFDHVGGMRDENGTIIFPNARVVVPRLEWAHWMRDEILASMREGRGPILKQTFDYYAQAGTLDIVEDNQEIAPGIRLVSMPGHTPGHIGVSITSGDETLMHIADAAHFPIQGQFTSAIPRFDSNPEQAITTRQTVFEQAAKDDVLVMAYHYPFPGIGHIVREGDGFGWQPLTE